MPRSELCTTLKKWPSRWRSALFARGRLPHDQLRTLLQPVHLPVPRDITKPRHARRPKTNVSIEALRHNSPNDRPLQFDQQHSLFFGTVEVGVDLSSHFVEIRGQLHLFRHGKTRHAHTPHETPLRARHLRAECRRRNAVDDGLSAKPIAQELWVEPASSRAKNQELPDAKSSAIWTDDLG